MNRSLPSPPPPPQSRSHGVAPTIVVTCKEAYDRLVHYIDAEYEELTGLSEDVEALVERPYIHLLAVSSSSASDYISLTTGWSA